MPKNRDTSSTRTSSSSNQSPGTQSSGSVSDSGLGIGSLLGLAGLGGVGGAPQGGESVLEPAGAADVINDIANQSINVEVESQRRGMESVNVRFISATEAVVSSGSGRDYTVNRNEHGESEHTCTCPDHTYRHSECRHIRAVEMALGEISRGTQQTGQAVSGSSGNTQLLINQVIPQIDTIEERQRSEAEQEAERTFVDDNVYYTNIEDDEFNQIITAAKNRPMEYEYNNVLNGSACTFGVELEITSGNGQAIARELQRLGLNGSGRVLGYTESRRNQEARDRNKWKVTLDGSVSYEIVSPVLKDDPQSWRELQQVVEVIKRHGGRVSESCGGHVHVGMDPLDNSRQRWRRLKKLICGYEKVLYRLSAGEFRNVRPNAIAHYAMPIAGRLEQVTDRRVNIAEDSGISGIRNVARTMMVRNTRYQSVNFENLANEGRPPTVEFRTFNGTLDPAQIQQNVRVSVGIMEAAKNAKVNDSHTRKRGEILKNTDTQEPITPGENDHNMVKKFLDICFPRVKDKESILGQYARSTWQY